MKKNGKDMLQVIDRKIDRIKTMISDKNHGKTSDELKLLQQLSELYQKRKAFLPS